MTAPLVLYTGNLCLLAPLVDSGAVDVAKFAYVARTCLRLLGLNIAFNGAIHYGFGAVSYETEESESKLKDPTY